MTTPIAAGTSEGYEAMGEFVTRVYGEEIHYGLWLDDPREPLATAQRRLTDTVVTAARLSPEDKFLDVGCGTGAVSRRAHALTGARTVGVSLSPWEVDRATALSGEPGTSFHVADVTALPFPEGTFAAAAAIEVLVHVPDKRGALANLHRSLRPGGILVLAEPVRRDRLDTVQVATWLGFRMAPLATADRYRALLAETGFSDVRVVDHTVQVRPSFELLRSRANEAAAEMGPEVAKAARMLVEIQSIVESRCDYTLITATR